MRSRSGKNPFFQNLKIMLDLKSGSGLKKGFVRLLSGGNNSIRIELADKADQYAEEMGERHLQSLKLLFSDFSDDEIKQLFHLYVKLFAGMERVEKYAEELD